MNGKPFSREDRKFVKENYRTKGGRWCAEQLGRNVKSVYGLVSRMEFTEHREALSDSQIIDAIRELQPDGLTDSDVVRHLLKKHGVTTDRHRVGKLRRELGLESNQFSEYRRRQISLKTKQQLESAGFEQLCDLRIAHWNAWKRSLGWPETLTVRAVQALECFWELGPGVPITRLQLCSMMGIESTCRTDPKSNAKGGTVLAELERAGFITRMNRACVQLNQGKGKSVSFYYLRPGVEKSVREECGSTVNEIERQTISERSCNDSGFDSMAGFASSGDGQCN